MTLSVPVALAGRAYTIRIGTGLLDALDTVLAPLRPTSVHVVTDRRVGALYGARVQAAAARVARTTLLELDGSETEKTLESTARVLDALADARADRGSVLVALGGGVIGDLAGFAAAIWMRGIRFVQVPTTLLAQVDSSVGGKTGVNHPTGKNLVGAFHQPEAVLTDLDTLRTLPARELSAGLAEVLKHGLLADAAYFDRTVADLPALLEGDAAALGRAIARSCEIKAGIVARDERETGDRALLNLGHTFGHAIETLAGYGTWLHGEAVGCGLVLAADLSRRLGLVDDAAAARVTDAVAAARLPTRVPDLPLAATVAAMRGDKKAQGGRIRFVVMEAIGRAAQREVPDELLHATLRAGGCTGAA